MLISDYRESNQKIRGCKLVVFRIASDGQSIISDSIIIEVDYPILDAAFSSDDLVLVSYYPQDEKPPLVGSISISSVSITSRLI